MKTKRLSIKQSVAIFCVLILVLIIACVTLGTISARAETASEDKHFVGLSGDEFDSFDLYNILIHIPTKAII